MPCFFSFDEAGLDNVIFSVANTFNGFSPEIIAGLDLDYKPLTGLFYWYEGALKLEKEIEGNE